MAVVDTFYSARDVAEQEVLERGKQYMRDENRIDLRGFRKRMTEILQAFHQQVEMLKDEGNKLTIEKQRLETIKSS